MHTEPPVTGNTPTMQFILDGKLYDTASATTAAISRGVLDGSDADYQVSGAQVVRYEDLLYRTPKGAFFVHWHRTAKFDRGKPVVIDEGTALTPDEAVQWVQREKAMILDATGLPLPEEA